MAIGQRAALKSREARPSEAALLSALAFRSKALWDYPREFMQACRGELTYSAQDLARGGFVVAEEDGRIVGFYALAPGMDGAVELEALFVEPDEAGRGLGRALIEHAKARAGSLGARCIVVQSDPHASRFYRAAGGVRAGSRPSGSIAGRVLPVFVIELAPARVG